MKNIKLILLGFLIVSSGLWLIADTLFPQPFTYFAFREVMNQYSGIVAFGAMSLCMLLATRPRWLENTLNGLDKGYRLHKWLGITAL
ncbi:MULTISPECIES: ferric reductase-like transmembrane domain-containing protein [Glaesserella]|uniref:ferric reductase-like transmembrane domain-containing protein n=1 Tax=Glaesserella TaxID=2094023 RepID=UPI001EDF0480|nr:MULTISPECIES: ferric reductase-like transmembrane domain-containing protein [Glaesserella]